MTDRKPDPYLKNEHVAGLYRMMALRLYFRYVDLRSYAVARGNDLVGHGPLPNQAEVAAAYQEAVGSWLAETPDEAQAACALAEFAGVIAGDRLIAAVMREGGPLGDEMDAYHQVAALAEVAGWLNRRALAEYADKVQAAGDGRAAA